MQYFIIPEDDFDFMENDCFVTIIRMKGYVLTEQLIICASHDKLVPKNLQIQSVSKVKRFTLFISLSLLERRSAGT